VYQFDGDYITGPQADCIRYLPGAARKSLPVPVRTGIVMAGLDPAIPLMEARPCHVIGIAGSSPAMTAGESISSEQAQQRAAAAPNAREVRRTTAGLCDKHMIVGC
jgi:hypothetical protein